MSLQERLAAHVFKPNWVPRAPNLAIARYHQKKAAPLSSYCAGDYIASFSERLLLLDNKEWELLGFALAVMPFAPTLSRTINGRLLRACKAYLLPEQLLAMDALGPQGVMPAPGALDDASKLAQGGIASLIASMAYDTKYAREITLRFGEQAGDAPLINPSLVEDLCKILLASQSWLWQELQ